MTPPALAALAEQLETLRKALEAISKGPGGGMGIHRPCCNRSQLATAALAACPPLASGEIERLERQRRIGRLVEAMPEGWTLTRRSADWWVESEETAIDDCDVWESGPTPLAALSAALNPEPPV